eukprot:3935645-Rhodomonas_salina.1
MATIIMNVRRVFSDLFLPLLPPGVFLSANHPFPSHPSPPHPFPPRFLFPTLHSSSIHSTFSFLLPRPAPSSSWTKMMRQTAAALVFALCVISSNANKVNDWSGDTLVPGTATTGECLLPLPASLFP